MKLTDIQIAATRDSLGATPVPEDHPVMDQLKEAFGEHTFFLDQSGLSLFVDPGEVPPEMEVPEGEPRLVMVAAWTDDNRQVLGAVEPVDRGITLPEAKTDSAG